MKPHVTLSVLAVLIGLILGVSFYTFIYAKGYSYLASDPAACTNCHVMRSYYDGWVQSTHHAAATCNDCHTPANPVAKLATKTANGFTHSWAFTTGRFPDAVQIKARNHGVTEAACRNCHLNLVQVINGPHAAGRGISCIHCHASAGHSGAMAFLAQPAQGARPAAAPISFVERKN
jgi:cytochrome c nitrite reductase small subunit